MIKPDIKKTKSKETLLQVDGLSVSFDSPTGSLPVVRDISFHINSGEIVGLVGESGSGKSVTALSLLSLIPSPPGHIIAGSSVFEGQDLLQMPNNQLRKIRGNRISMIFQEPMTSLNPLMSVGEQIAEVFKLHTGCSKKQAQKLTLEMLKKVQIPAPEKRMKEFPFQMSGGMRQRIMIAMALCCNPALLIADEPTTALDVTIQSEIIDLLMDMRQEYDSAILMITHDLGVIAESAERVIVMYAGQIVETGTVDDIFDAPAHPYTNSLLKSVPILGRRAKYGRQALQEISGTVPDPADLPKGCAFSNRCPNVENICQNNAPSLNNQSPEKSVRCHFPLTETIEEKT